MYVLAQNSAHQLQLKCMGGPSHPYIESIIVLSDNNVSNSIIVLLVLFKKYISLKLNSRQIDTI